LISKYVDTAAVIQVIGNIYNHPDILDYDDKYFFTEEDFPNEFHKIVFGTIYRLHDLGAKEISYDSISDYLSGRPKYEAIFKQNKGFEWLTEITDKTVESAFDYYYQRVKKMTLLREFDNRGIDVRFIYDPDNILDTKKRQEQEDLLDNTDLAQLAQKVLDEIEEVKSKYVDNDAENSVQAGAGIFELLENLKINPDVGVPLYGPLINTVTRGARLTKLYLRSAPTGAGKAIPNDTIIPTPNGNRKVGDIRPGDYLFGDDGQPVRVLQIHPQPEKKQIYVVKFSDGRTAKCCKDHLWEYFYKSHRGYASRVESTEEILNRTAKLKNNFKNPEGKGYRFRIKLNSPLEYSKKELPIDPYVFGLLLGDGSFRQHPSNKTLQFSSQDNTLPSSIAEIMGWEYVKSSDRNYTYYFKKNNQNVWVEHYIKDELAPLFNAYSQDKYIPRVYLEGSVNQRYALLQGLMDTDGSVDEKGQTSFTNSSSQLVADVVELCRGLGFITSVLEDSRSDKYTDGCFTVHIQCKKENKPNLFRLKRKAQRARDYASSNKRCEHKNYLTIENIYSIDEWTNMTCFTVDNNSHLFLMNDCIVTHNTRSMIADACYIACNKIYDEEFGWIYNGQKEPVLYIATEQKLDEIQTMMLAFLSNVNEEHIMKAQYDEGEEERVLKAASIIQDSPLYVDELPDFSLQDVENRIKRAVRDLGVRYVVLDYIHTSIKILEEITRRSGGVKLREDNILFMMAIKLKDLCNQLGIFILSATQLNADYQISTAPDQNLLRGAKSIGDKVDIGMIWLSVTEKDLESLQDVLASGCFDTPNMKLSIYKNRRGRWKSVYLWCKADLGTCRIKPMFCTSYNYELQAIEDLNIIVDKGAF